MRNKSALISIFLSIAATVTVLVALAGERSTEKISAPSNLSKGESPARVETTQKKVGKRLLPGQINLKAKSAIVWDIKNKKQLYEQNADAPYPLASLTKMMVAIAASELVPLDTTVSVSEKAIASEGDSGFDAGEQWKLKDLINFTLIESANDGASAIASVIRAANINREAENHSGDQQFLAAMNDLAERIGLKDTYFLNETGLDVDEIIGGAYGSARDIALLMDYALYKHPDILEATTYEKATFISLNNKIHEAKNTNDIIGTLPGFLGGKTGLTDLAGGNLTIVFQAGPARPLAAVVLGSTKKERFTDMEKLVWSVIEFNL